MAGIELEKLFLKLVNQTTVNQIFGCKVVEMANEQEEGRGDLLKKKKKDDIYFKKKRINLTVQEVKLVDGSGGDSTMGRLNSSPPRFIR